jgi:hypothetical protein
VISRQHGRGHGTLVSHSTDVGCISEETKVKKLFLIGTTVAADGNIGIGPIF